MVKKDTYSDTILQTILDGEKEKEIFYREIFGGDFYGMYLMIVRSQLTLITNY